MTPTRSMQVSTTTSRSASGRRGPAFWRRLVDRSIVPWVHQIDLETRETIAHPRAWGEVSAVALLVILVAGVAPGVSAFFDLEPWGALGTYLPTLVSGVSLGILQKRGRLSLLGFGVLAVVGMACFQFFMWSLVSRSRLPGASVMASLPILLACYHGYALRAGPRPASVA